MRLSVFVSALSMLALVALVAGPGPADAAKSKMGCEIGTEVWNAGAGKCVPGTPKYAKKSAAADAGTEKKAAKKKKAPAKK
jgi:hypothetical protein